MGGKCNIRNVAYSGDVWAKDKNGNLVPGEPKKYYGQTIHWKQRQYGHTNSFNTPKKVLTRKDKETGDDVEVTIAEQIEEKRSKSELANYVWKLKLAEKEPIIKWQIEKKAFTYKNGMKYCDLCVTEKTLIALGDPAVTLNKRTEIFRKCMHKNRYKLSHEAFMPP